MIESFARIQPEKSLSQKIESQIREAIENKSFLPGDKLPGEIELAEKFGVSRTAIREALRMLAGRGLVEIRKGSGVYIAEPDVANIVDPFYMFLDMKCGEYSFLHLIRTRLFMEPQIARMAAIHRSDDTAEHLMKLCQRMKKQIKQPQKNIPLDIEFHRCISKATDNPLIPIIMDPILHLLNKFIASTYPFSEAPEAALKFHQDIAKSILDKNPEDAYNAMRKHLTQAEEHAIKFYKLNDVTPSN